MTGERQDGWERGRPSEPKVHVVEVTETGTRLDRFLAGRIPELSRARLQELIRQGFVTSPTGTAIEAAHKVRAGDAFRVDLPAPVPAEPAAEDMPLAVVYEDEHLIVIDKPAGQVVHPAAGHAGGTLVNALLAHCGVSLSGIGGVKRPGIVHRLDKDTSGLIVVAKSDAAHQGLAAQFASHGADGRLSRTYLAFVWGAPARRTGRIEARLGRSRTDRKKIAVASGETGRHAVTRYEVIETFGPRERAPLASLCVSGSRRGGRIRSAFTWRISGIPSSETRCTGRGSSPGPGGSERKLRPRSVRSAGRRFMRPGSASSIP